MSGPVAIFSGIALGIDILACFFFLLITGFFAYPISEMYGESPWFLDLGIAFAVICFLLLLATSILGCMTSCGKGHVRSLHLTKVGLDAFAWVLTLISAACNTAKPEASLSEILDTCDAWYGFNSGCSFGVAVALLWTNFCLLIVSVVLHGFASGYVTKAPPPKPQEETETATATTTTTV